MRPYDWPGSKVARRHSHLARRAAVHATRQHARLFVVVALLALSCGGGPESIAGAYRIQMGVPGCQGFLQLTQLGDEVGGEWICGTFGSGMAFGSIDAGAVEMDFQVPFFEPMHMLGTWSSSRITGKLNDGFDIVDVPFEAVR